MNETSLVLSKREFLILKKGPRFILNDPSTAAKRRTDELQFVYQKLQNRNTEQGWILPKAILESFINKLEDGLIQIHNKSIPSKDLDICRNLIERIHKSNTILRKTDKSKVFHLGNKSDYTDKAKQYMLKTNAYENLGDKNPLLDIVNRTNSMLLSLLTGKHINRQLYEKFLVDINTAELAHLYFLPKAHKLGTPLRPIVAGMKSPTIEISRWLDSILRPLFDQMAMDTSILNGVQLIFELEKWASQFLNVNTYFLTMDVSDLYTMVPQEGGIQAIKKMLRCFHLDQINSVKTPIILLLARFVMKNNFFFYDGAYYKQIRGGAMGSPLTLTISNAYMYFFQTPIVKWIGHTNGIYRRYIDDIFLASNKPKELLHNLVQHWNRIDINIKLIAEINLTVNFLDVSISNQNGRLHTSVYHKPSHELYFLPFNSAHAKFIKKNIPYEAIIRAIRYSSDLISFKKEESHITLALLLNGYTLKFINEQYYRAMYDMNCAWPNRHNYHDIRNLFLRYYFFKIKKNENKKKKKIDFNTQMIMHFTYCKGMEFFGPIFHKTWNEILGPLAISTIKPMIGFRNNDSLQKKLVKKKPEKTFLKISPNIR
jgi:hypothetical protein